MKSFNVKVKITGTVQLHMVAPTKASVESTLLGTLGNEVILAQECYDHFAIKEVEEDLTYEIEEIVEGK